MRANAITLVVGTLCACGPSVVLDRDAGPGQASAPCIPGVSTCTPAGFSATCQADGTEALVYCDPIQGVGCDVDTGKCVGLCAPQALGKSYIGCDYYPTQTSNDVDNRFDFAVSVSNTSGFPATVTIEWGSLQRPIAFTVDPGQVKIQALPWVASLKGCTAYGHGDCSMWEHVTSASVPKGAFRLRSTAPVTVYQFNPLDYMRTADDGTPYYSYSNDASLLLPANVLTGHYVAASWPEFGDVGDVLHKPGFVTITATADDTDVTITPRAATDPGPGLPPLAAGLPARLTMNRGDVIQLESYDDGKDLTGTTIEATRPVQVIGGHHCTFIPEGWPACDHLEEVMFPVEVLGTEYVVTPPATPTVPGGKEQVVRIVAVEGGTTLSYEPPQPEAPASIASAGDSVTFTADAAAFRVVANHKVIVTQQMMGMGPDPEANEHGDPAMALAVPIQQYRRDYLFHAPTNYELNYVNLIAPLDAAIVLDGVQVAGLTPIGEGGLGWAAVPLGSGTDGNHTVTADQPLGISVYGYGRYTSYWYPGGLDLETIVVP